MPISIEDFPASHVFFYRKRTQRDQHLDDGPCEPWAYPIVDGEKKDGCLVAHLT